MLPENYLAVGGPVLVQMKFWDTLSDRGLADACDIFAQQIHRTTAVFGLLIYHVRDGENPKQTVPNPGTRVVAVSADSLVDALAARPLSSVLFAMRNAIVHGVAYRG
ncbi:hypothetical protein A5748_15735 [Nocardia sp. 852002-51244_SCH5132740]|nr:hypothetical protein A5748_15735 [Nocardia sp. 852002-51244_SCH5132740]